MRIDSLTPFRGALLLALSVLLARTGSAQPAKPTPPASKPASKPAKPPGPPPEPQFQAGLEPRAVEILKAASSRLAAAKTMTFTAVVTYESPSRLGATLAYLTKSEVTLQRPDKLKVITSGDGPASELYYDGKVMMAFEPEHNLVAVGEAPATIDAMLKVLYDLTGTYLPYTDVIVADPYGDLAPGLNTAFYVGQSHVVDGTTTDIVAYEGDGVFVEMWIGAEDKLPRMARATYADDPLQLRHQAELSHWQIDSPVAADAFGSAQAANATRIEFAHPKTKAPAGPAPGGASAKPKATPKSPPKPQ